MTTLLMDWHCLEMVPPEELARRRAERESQPSPARKASGGPMVIRDMEPAVSPIDGTVISSHSRLRAYMRERNLAPFQDYASSRRNRG